MENYSEELKQHLFENEYIQEVHFDAAGNHHFNAHELNGKKYSRIATDIQGGLTDEQASEPFLITESISRDEILGTPHMISEEDLVHNPELTDAGVVAEETVIIPPAESTPNANAGEITTEVVSTENTNAAATE